MLGASTNTRRDPGVACISRRMIEPFWSAVQVAVSHNCRISLEIYTTHPRTNLRGEVVDTGRVQTPSAV